MRPCVSGSVYSDLGVGMRQKILDQVNKNFHLRNDSRARGGWMLTPEGTIAVAFALMALGGLAWVVHGWT